VINLRRLDEAISSINGWYMERGFLPWLVLDLCKLCLLLEMQDFLGFVRMLN
jgi:hypothetical protein